MSVSQSYPKNAVEFPSPTSVDQKSVVSLLSFDALFSHIFGHCRPFRLIGDCRHTCPTGTTSFEDRAEMNSNSNSPKLRPVKDGDVPPITASGLFKSVDGKTIEIRDVWASNLEEEMEKIREILEKFPYVAMVRFWKYICRITKLISHYPSIIACIRTRNSPEW